MLSPNQINTLLPKLDRDGANWLIWKHRTQMFLTAKKLSHHLDHSTPPPPEPSELKSGASADETQAHEQAIANWNEWKQQDSEVKFYIESGIPDTLLVKVLNSTSAKVLWETILSDHQTRSETYQAEMLRRLQNERCSEVEDVRLHFAKMLKLREELAATGKTITEDHFTSILTNSLPTSVYGTVITTAYTALKMHDRSPTSRQLIEAIEEEYTRRQFASGGQGSSTALFANPQGQSKRNKKKKPNRCTNVKCRYRHTHEFKDCRSEGGPQHASNPLPVRNPQNSQNGQNAQGGRNARQMMRANIAQDAEESIDHAFSTIASFSTADITASTDPSERVEVYDSGATCHMSPYIDAFTNFEFINSRAISAADNRTFEAVGKGNLHINIPNGDGFTSVTLRDVLYAPTIAFTLISLSRADKAGYTTIIEDGELHLIDRANNNKVVGRIPARNGLWSVRSSKALENGTNLLPGSRTLTAISLMDLHRCLGHISPSTAAQLINKQILAGVTIRDWDVKFCEVCALAKIKRHPFPKSRAHPAQDIGDVIHSDVWGPASVRAIGGENYAVTWIDELSRYGTVEGMRAKSDAFTEYKAYEAWLRVQRGKVIRHLQSDRGGEYTGNEFLDYLRQQGTTRRLTVHDSPQSNGIAERCNGVLLEHVRAMLADSGLPKFLWKEALKFAMWIRNRTSTHRLNGRTPYEAFYGVKPDIGDIHLWGSRIWVRDLSAGKLDPRGREGHFIGYDAESKGCRVYWPNSRLIGVERDLIFEDRPVNDELVLLPEPSTAKNQRPKPTATTPPEMPNPPDTQPPEADSNPGDQPDSSNNVDTTPSKPTPSTSTETPLNATETTPPVEPTGRIRKPSRYIREVLEGTIDGGTARSKSRLPKGVQLPTGTFAAEVDYGSDLDLELEHEATACLADEIQVIEVAMASAPNVDVTDDDPKSLMEAMNRSDWPEWKEAMDEELALMAKYNVWDEVDQPEDTNIVGCRWVFRIKRDSSGKILKYRARLVAQGFTQLYGVDFHETFAPVARLSSIRTIIALAASEDWELHQMDVKSAYLNSPIDTAIYMRLPPGYGRKGKVARVKKGIYGLKQSGNLWHTGVLIENLNFSWALPGACTFFAQALFRVSGGGFD